MATTAFDQLAQVLESGDDEFLDQYNDLTGILPLETDPLSPMGAGQVAQDVVYEMPEESPAPALGLLDLRGFYVSSGRGIYEGALRDGEEARDSFFVDVQDYDTGEIRRTWGVMLAEVMSGAIAQFDLQPGSRIHLIQQGKQETVVSGVDAENTMVYRTVRGNGWACLPDRGPLPSHLASLMAGVNVDQMLDRIALRHDMAMDDERLGAWKGEQKRILSRFDSDPQTVKSWLARQLALTAAEESDLVSKAVELLGYSDDDPGRKKLEIESRMQAIKLMSPDARYDFLMHSAKPHLVEANKALEASLSAEIAEGVEQLAAMATAPAASDSPEAKAMRSSLAQSLEGLTVLQQRDYLASRREQVVAARAAALAAVDARSEETGPRVSRTEVIDAYGMSAEEYQLLLQERFSLADSDEERAQMLKQEIEARKDVMDRTRKEYEQIEKLNQHFAGQRDVDATSYMLGRAASALAHLVCDHVMPRVNTMFESLGGVGAWRRNDVELQFDNLRSQFAAAREAPEYQAFLHDPAIVAASVGSTPGQMVADHPDFSRTEVVVGHLKAQDGAPAPAGKKPAMYKGLWSNVIGAAHDFKDRLAQMEPEHLLKGGKVDSEWVKRMQQGIDQFRKDIKQTLMPEELMAQLQEMLASALASLRIMLDLVKSLVKPKAPEMSSPGMEP